MKHPSILLAVFLIQCGIANAQRTPPRVAEEPDSQTNKTRYLATLAEYRVDAPFSELATEDEIVSLIQKRGIKPTETIRLTAVSNTQSHVHFGKRVTVTTGKAIVGRGVSTRQTQAMEIGTILEITIVPHESGAMADVSYSSSRLQGGDNEDSPPDVITTTIDSTQIVALGKQKLLGGSSSGNPTYFVITIMESP